MDSSAVLLDAASRPLTAVGQVLDGIDVVTLHARPAGRGSSIAWLVWHAARQMDAQLPALNGAEQVWVSGGWAERLGLPRGADESGFGDTDAEVASLHVDDPAALLAYVRAVLEAFVQYVTTLSDADLDEIVDTSYEPPVTRGVRLVSLIDDAVAHLAQAAYARGLVQGWSIGY